VAGRPVWGVACGGTASGGVTGGGPHLNTNRSAQTLSNCADGNEEASSGSPLAASASKSTVIRGPWTDRSVSRSREVAVGSPAAATLPAMEDLLGKALRKYLFVCVGLILTA